MQLKVYLSTARLPFLILTPVCVLLGVGLAQQGGREIDVAQLILALAGALLAHLSVNWLNEYRDFRSGLDLQTERTPFSGGSGALPQHPSEATNVLVAGVIALLLLVGVGLYFVVTVGGWIIPIGLTGVLLIATYTDRINRHPWLCLVAPGLGFGLLMVLGTQYVLAGEIAIISWVIGLVPFFLVNNLLLLNQYPDIAADAQSGRRHVAIVYGVTTANRIYALFSLAAALLIFWLVVTALVSPWSLVALLPMLMTWYAWRGAVQYRGALGEHTEFLAANVATAILVPLILGVVLILTPPF
ncbi:MAG: prenyltransferase [bacterium]